MEEKKIQVLNQEICYIHKEFKSKYTLLFLHGWGTSKESFLPIINKLDDVNLISIDFPGFGESEEPKTVYGVEDYANLMDEFIKLLSLDNIIIVGHSFGCRVSFYLANKNSNIKKMLLTGSAGIKPRRTIKYYIGVGGYKFQKFLVKTPFYFQYKEDLLKTSGSEDYKNASPHMKKILIKTVNEDLKFLLPSITQKVVLFWGESDVATPVGDAKIMENEISNCELVVVKGTHFAFLENVDDFVKEIKRLK